MIARLGPLVVALALIAGCAAPAAQKRTVGSSGRIFADPEPGVPGIKRFAYLNANVARGGQPDSEGIRWLKNQGFRTIISLRPSDSEREEARALGMRFMELPVDAGAWGSAPPTSAQLDSFFLAVTDTTQLPVFFHCKRGADRTGMFCALYRIQVDHWTHEEAVAEMQAFGYNDFFRDLIHVVERYEPRPVAASATP